MRLIAAGAALHLFVFAAGGVAQTTGPQGVPLPVHGVKPSEVVARLAREALHAPGDSASWASLGQAIPEMALAEGADMETTFEAARVADSLSSATGVTAVDAGTAPSTTENARSPMAGGVPRLPVDGVLGGTTVLALAAFVVMVFRRRSRSTRSPAPREVAAGRRWSAAAMASGGIAVPDIARRMGLSQEGVDLALRLKGGSAESARLPVERPRHPASAPQAAAASVEQARMRRELMQGAGRLRDQRVTYGRIQGGVA